MHPDTIAALRLLVLALEVQPEGLADDGYLAEHMADVIEGMEINQAS